LKKVSKFALKLVHWLVVREGGREAGREGEESIFLEKFLELSENDLPQMELSMHVREGGREGGREDGAEALELLSLLLTRHKCTLPEGGKDGGGEGGGGGTEQLLLLLLPEEEVQLRFIQWLQQSASEEDLRERIERQRARREGGREGGLEGGKEEGGVLDPLGLNKINVNFEWQGSSEQQQARPEGGREGGRAGMVGTKEQIYLLQKLQLATVGGEGGEGGREGGRKQGGRGGGKYTRNRSRALKATKAGGRDGGREGGGGASSIVPQDEGFDPLLFLSVVHGGSSWEELVKGQGYLGESHFS